MTLPLPLPIRAPWRDARAAAADDDGAAGAHRETSLRIGGIHCAACVPTIEAALRALAGVDHVQVSAATGIASVRWDARTIRASQLIDAVRAAGYEAVPDTAAQARVQRRRESRQALWRLFVAAFCAMQVMMLATPAYVASAGELAADQKRLFDIAGWLLTLPVMGFAATPFFAGAWASLRARRVGMDVPVALGAATAFIASSLAAFDPAGPLGNAVYFDSLTMFIAFLLGGRWLELRARHRAEAALEHGAGALPAVALRVADDGRVDAVEPVALQRGDRVRVPAGAAFAADGVVLAGVTRVDESLLTGESRALPRGPGDAVIAGSVNLGEPVEMRVEHAGADTRYEAIVSMMRAARSQRPAMLAVADRWAGPFVWGVLLLAGGAAALWSTIDPARAAWVAVSVLIVTCPCALSLAAPTALVAAAGAMGRRGVLLRRLDAVEALASMRTLLIDKTGTLTVQGSTEVTLQSLLPGLDAPALAALQACAAGLAAWSSHPVAQALRASAGDAPAATAWNAVREVAGAGVEAHDAQGRRWRLGAAAWVGAPFDADPASRAWLGVDGRALARVVVNERLRDDVATAVRALQDDGVWIGVLSGDDPVRAARVAAQIGADEVHGGLSPEGKLAAVGAAQARGERVGMLGDGINDAPVLAQADVSFAMGAGASIARLQADGVLVADRLADLVAARRLARRAVRVVHQNIGWAIAYNATCIPLAVAGMLPPWLAAAGMAASSLVVVLNASRLAR